jgi:hypothetical protein
VVPFLEQSIILKRTLLSGTFKRNFKGILGVEKKIQKRNGRNL